MENKVCNGNGNPNGNEVCPVTCNATCPTAIPSTIPSISIQPSSGPSEMMENDCRDKKKVEFHHTHKGTLYNFTCKTLGNINDTTRLYWKKTVCNGIGDLNGNEECLVTCNATYSTAMPSIQPSSGSTLI